MRDDIPEFDFDEIVERRGTHSSKYDGMAGRFGLSGDDLIPMWVADMDFRAPPPVNQAIQALVDHGVHGYFGDDTEMKDAVVGWLTDRHGWTPEPEWITTTHGLVSAIGLAIQAMSEPEDGIIVFSPVYHMFGNTVRATGRRLIESPLNEIQGRYEMDFDRLDAQAEGARIVLLCSPHNPGGRVWRREELRQLAEFCEYRNLILISDEIHMDLVFPESTHTMTALAAPQIMDRLVTLVAPTKTFNLAGALTGFPIISNPDLRAKFMAIKAACGLSSANRFGAIAATAAYQHGAPWLDALIPYLQANRDRMHQAVTESLPGVRSMPLEATYLAWLDFSGTGLSPKQALDKVNQKARIVVNAGPSFGTGGENWLRFNFACPHTILDTAIGRLVDVFG